MPARAAAPATSLRAVLFDLDNTLYDHAFASREALLAAAAEFEETRTLEAETLCREFTRHNDACWLLATRGEMTREDIRVARFRRTLEGFGLVSLEAERLSERYLASYRRRAARVPGARATVLALRRRVAVGIVTNGFPDLVEDKLSAVGLAGLLHPIVVADRLESMKPRPEPFRLALRELGIEPREALYVGDSLEVDVAGARAAGLFACWFNREGIVRPAEGPKPDFEVRRLGELPALLDGATAGLAAGAPSGAAHLAGAQPGVPGEES